MKKKLFALLLCALCLICFAACGETEEAVPEESTDQAEAVAVQPLPATLDPAALTDCMAAAAFTAEDISMEDPAAHTLSMNVFEAVYYDAVELSQLQVGGEITQADGTAVTVESIEDTEAGMEINGGIDAGGISLRSVGGGIFEPYTFDDHSIYRELGTAVLPISADCVFTDDSDPDNPGQTYTAEELIALLATEGDPGCNQLNTTVTVEAGAVTAINRIFIP